MLIFAVTYVIAVLILIGSIVKTNIYNSTRHASFYSESQLFSEQESDAGGVSASLNVGMILGKDTDDRYDNLYVHGDKGTIRSCVEFNQSGEVSYSIYTKEGVTERKITVPQNYSLEVEQLGKCILSGEKPYVSPEFSIKNAELMDRVFAQIGY